MEDDGKVQRGCEPWRAAVESGDLSQLQDLVQEQGIAVLTKNYLYRYNDAVVTPLIEASERQHMDIVRYLLDECSSVVDVNACCDKGCTSLHYATYGDHLELVRYLVEKGGNVHFGAGSFGETPLQLAIVYDHVDIAKFMIGAGLGNLDMVTKDYDDPSETSALDMAVGYPICYQDDYCGNLDIVRYIMESGYWTDEEKADRATQVLPAPCQSGNLEIAKYLVESCRANVNAYGSDERHDGLTPLIVACQYGCLEIVQYLVESCHANVEAYSTGDVEQKLNPLLRACMSEDLEIVQYLVEKCNANVDTLRDYKEATPFCWAVKSRKLDLVQYLIEACRLDIETTDKKGNTVLHEAASFGSLGIVQHLVEKCGSNTKAQNDDGNDGCTTLHWACSRVDAMAMAVVKYLVEECNINVDTPNGQGETALHIACKKRNVEMVQFLIQSGRSVNVNAIDTNGRTAMHSCLVRLRFDVVDDAEKCLLIAKSIATIDQTCFGTHDNDGKTILHLACEKAQCQLVQYLVQDCRVVASDIGATDLHGTSRKRHESAQRLTHLLHMDVNAADKNGQTALHYACNAVVNSRRGDRRCWTIVQCLLETGRVNVNAQDNQSKTALHHCFVNPALIAHCYSALQEHIQTTCFNIVQSLVESGQVNVDITDHTGQTVLHYYCSVPNIDTPLYLIEQAHANVDVMDNEGRTALHRAASIPRGAGARSGLRLVLFLVSRLTSDPVGYDDLVEGLAPILIGTGNDGHMEPTERFWKRQRTYR